MTPDPELARAIHRERLQEADRRRMASRASRTWWWRPASSPSPADDRQPESAPALWLRRLPSDVYQTLQRRAERCGQPVEDYVAGELVRLTRQS